jgi:hypothetical protein
VLFILLLMSPTMLVFGKSMNFELLWVEPNFFKKPLLKIFKNWPRYHNCTCA